MSWLFQTCIKLQTSLDRRFLRLGMTVQEASVLLRCVEARKVTPGQLAIVLGRDKGKITRFVDRLESSRLLTRDIDRRDRRFSILKPTARGKQVARALASVFESAPELVEVVSQIVAGRIAETSARLAVLPTMVGGEKESLVMRAKRYFGIS